jgi:hypothetical protein
VTVSYLPIAYAVAYAVVAIYTAYCCALYEYAHMSQSTFNSREGNAFLALFAGVMLGVFWPLTLACFGAGALVRWFADHADKEARP